MESLIKSGAFDRFADRSTLLSNLDMIIAFAQRLQKQASSGQTDIFGEQIDDTTTHQPKLELHPPAVPIESHEQLLWERELLGLYLSQHPLERFETFLAEQTIPLNSLTADHDGRAVSVGGAITDVREITTKNGQKMAFVKLEDQTAEIEVVLFPGSYQQTVGLWERDKVVLIQGKVSSRDRNGTTSSEPKIMVNDAREITPQQAEAYQATGKKKKTPKAKALKKPTVVPDPEFEISSPTRVYIRLQTTSDEQTLLSLKQTIDQHRGDTEVVLVLGEATTKQAIKLPGGIDHTGEGVVRLQSLVGNENLVIK
jgi:DNA polymerase III alpha subunit